MGLCQQGADLATAIANNTELSSFAQLLANFPSLLGSLIPEAIPAVTVLIPTNAAFDKYVKQTGQQPASLPLNQLQALLEYHIMAAPMTRRNFTVPRGLVIPTLLRDSQYNNRSAGAQLVGSFGQDAAQGNVLFVSQDPINPAKLKVRQQASIGDANLRGGLGGTATISAIDGYWDLGYFQMVDT